MRFNVIIVLVSILISCTYLTPKEEEIKEALNKELDLSMFDQVRQGDSIISYSDFRKRFKYISVVCLKKGCQPCYPKFKKWQNKMDSLKMNTNSTLLFIINGDSYRDFINNVPQNDNFIDRYYTIIDPKFLFNVANKSIPNWIINSGILIDTNNKIKLIGPPYINSSITELYRSICTQQE